VSARIFVAGTWRQETAAPYAEAARRVGELIARAGHDLGCGPGTGIAEHVIAGFRSVSSRPGLVHFILPAVDHMRAVGEVVRYDLADRIEQTDLDYPMRNVLQIRRSQGLVVIAGGGGSQQEINLALHDYGIPTGVLRGSGQAARALELTLGPVFPEWAPLVCLSDDPEEITRWVLERVNAPAR
jgi:uncharacterized protein (TIGR00725 family)